MLCLVNLVYAGRFSVNQCGVDARLLVRSFIESELVPTPRECTRPWRLAEPVNALLYFQFYRDRPGGASDSPFTLRLGVCRAWDGDSSYGTT